MRKASIEHRCNTKAHTRSKGAVDTNTPTACSLAKSSNIRETYLL